MITTLDWDSKFFQQKVGKVQKEKFFISELPDLFKEKKDRDFDLVYLFLDEIDIQDIRQLENAGAMLVDRKITYHKFLSKPAKNYLSIEPFQGPVTSKLFDLAVASGHKSRFFKDLRTKEHFEKLYRLWIENSAKKEIADEILVSRHNGEISGFVTLKKKKGNCGEIGLIAVDEAFRGMGIGKELLIAADHWYEIQNCSEAIVVTQFENIEACNLYERAGYKVLNSQFVFHY